IYYVSWIVLRIQKRKLPASLLQLIPVGLFLSLLGLELASVCWPLAVWGCLGLVGLYMVSMMAASVFTAARYGWALLPLLPLVFACYHFAYGCGFLRGVWDFVIMRRGPRPAYTALTRA